MIRTAPWTAYVTRHAAEQFRARIAPSLDVDAARTAILRGLEAPVSIAPAHSGRGIYVRVRRSHVQPYSFRALVGPGRGHLPAVITILRSGH